MFIDFSKAFDTVDHDILLKRLGNIGLSGQAVAWFENYLSDRTQCVQFRGKKSEFLTVHKGVPQGSVLGPLLFALYINNVGRGVPKASFHFYADDTIIYCCCKSISKAFEALQSAFNMVQAQLQQLKLVLNADKTKTMLFSKATKIPQPLPQIVTLQDKNEKTKKIEGVSTYKYLGFILDDRLTFTSHVENLVKKLQLKLGFYFRNKSCFSFETRRRLVLGTFLPVLDYGDILYRHAPGAVLGKLDAVYHGALRYITNLRPLTHRCALYMRVGWPSLTQCRLSHWYVFIYKAILGQLPSYLCSLISLQENSTYQLRSQDKLLLSEPSSRIKFGEQAFQFSAPKAWNELQKTMDMQELISLPCFNDAIKIMEEDKLRVCTCF